MIVLNGGYAAVPIGWLDTDGYYDPQKGKPVPVDYSGSWALISLFRVDTVRGIRMNSHRNPDGDVAEFSGLSKCSDVVELLLKIRRQRASYAENTPTEQSRFAPEAPQIPTEAQEFAVELSKLTSKYRIREAKVEVRLPRDYRVRPNEQIDETMTITVSNVDGRGRPRRQVRVTADIHVSLPVVYEPDSTD